MSRSGRPETSPASVNDRCRSRTTSGNSGPIASSGARALTAASQPHASVSA
jgi:hypothetical protein